MTELKQLADEVREAERNDVMYEAPHAVETLLTAIDAHDCAQSEAVRELVAALRDAMFACDSCADELNDMDVVGEIENADEVSAAMTRARAALAKHGGGA